MIDEPNFKIRHPPDLPSTPPRRFHSAPSVEVIAGSDECAHRLRNHCGGMRTAMIRSRSRKTSWPHEISICSAEQILIHCCNGPGPSEARRRDPTSAKAADAHSQSPSKNERDDAHRGGRRARATPSSRAAFILARRFFAPFGFVRRIHWYPYTASSAGGQGHVRTTNPYLCATSSP